MPALHIPKKEKATLISECGLYLCRQRPTLPHTFACSTIGPAGLNFRVRDGNGWIPRGKITDNLRRLRSAEARAEILCAFQRRISRQLVAVSLLAVSLNPAKPSQELKAKC